MIVYENGFICHRVKVENAKDGCVLCQHVERNPKMIDKGKKPKDIFEKLESIILRDLPENFYICSRCRGGLTIRLNAIVRKMQGVKASDDYSTRIEAYRNRYDTEYDLYHDDKQLEITASEIIISKINKLSKKKQHENN